MALNTELVHIAQKAQKAARRMSEVSSDLKNRVLVEMARSLLKEKRLILEENGKDLASVKKKGLPQAMIERLCLDDRRIKGMADSLFEISKLNDPVGEEIKAWKRPNGLMIHKVRVPIGAILIIYESRPNVTSDCIGLCLKSGNAVILRGGSEALRSNLAIYRILEKVARKYKLPEGLISIVDTTDRAAVNLLLKMNDHIDLVIPRGGEGLIREVTKNSSIPVIKHYKGICHVYVDEAANLNMAEEICFNAKVQRPGVCNAMETLLVHKDVAVRFLPHMAKRFKEAGVELRGCPITRRILKGIKKATEKDWVTEYLGLILSIRVVESLGEAIEHINDYGSHHSDTIVTDDYSNAMRFLNLVDSACVYVNASTRFTDGYQFGMGAEIGISTDKLHARGPMALEELTTYKYMIFGEGQIRK
ncbi:MAG: glutamate-5-semialdehyde dehydrogenase [Candidatus Omnitrophica bacterium]|nr:glutamate-5-semialdehyde dehydrogenase [Candidatus Omnitrophota bacterium]MDD5610149.1 glutamate-5-semialdehyde dehydrogenase [Candidatus Omnitrophota bacterium]